MIKNILFTIRFYLLDVPLWVPKRLLWAIKRKRCLNEGCVIEKLYEENGGEPQYAMCVRCGAYIGRNKEASSYPLIGK